MSSDLTKKELGVTQAVLERYNKEKLPALLAMKAKVDVGEVLTERELTQLSNAIDEAANGEFFAEKHPQYKSLIEKASRLYEQISAKNEENVQRARGSS